MSVVASYLQVSARYDGMVLLNGSPIDPRAHGGQNPGPSQRVGAFVGYGSYGPSSRLTRTFRLDTLLMATMEGSIMPTSSPRIRVPAFARRLHVTPSISQASRFVCSVRTQTPSSIPSTSTGPTTRPPWPFQAIAPRLRCD